MVEPSVSTTPTPKNMVVIETQEGRLAFYDAKMVVLIDGVTTDVDFDTGIVRPTNKVKFVATNTGEWVHRSGNLPPSLTLDPSGVITGVTGKR